MDNSVEVGGPGTQDQPSNGELDSLHVRRLVNFFRTSIRDGTSWAVYEPNDERLWRAVARDVTSFLMDQWRKGVLRGEAPEEAFFVLCDESNNPPEEIHQGRLSVDVSIAPVRPAEFITFRVSYIMETS